MRSVLLAGVSMVAACAAATTSCYLGPVEDDRAPSARALDEAGAGEASAAGGDAAGAAASGLPCEVHALLTTSCAGCHAPPLKAPVRLVTYEDLLSKGGSDPTRPLAELAVMRMRSATSPMPPPPNAAPASAAIVAMEKWVAAGYPRGTCGAPGDAGADAPTTAARPVVCTSGLTWGSGRKGVTMNPGRACIACHDALGQREGPIVEIGGTVYPTFSEPDLCYGASGATTGAHVVITDAIGQVFDLPVGETGNFAKLAGGTPVRRPFRAKVVVGTQERVMSAAQTSGDCNGCHTATGANGAPGRIALP
jgi:hypothetical protein